MIRKQIANSGLISISPRATWPIGLPRRKASSPPKCPTRIVVTPGLDDRQPIREPAADKSYKASDKKDAKAKPHAKSDAKDAKTGEAKPAPPPLRSPMTRPSIPNCRRATPPTTMRRRPLRQGDRQEQSNPRRPCLRFIFSRQANP